MKTKGFVSLIAAGMCFFALPSVAAPRVDFETNRDEDGKIVQGPYMTTHISKNWFIELGAGASVYFGGLERYSDCICPVIDFSFGKWFTPEIATRINCNYSPQLKEYYQDQLITFGYFSVHADLMWDLLTSFGGYRWNRIYHLMPYVGAGYSFLYDAPHFSTGHEFTLHGGFINKFRLCDWVDFNLELRGSAANNHHDRIEQRNFTVADIDFTVSGGFTFNIGRREFQRAKTYAAAQVVEATSAKDAQIASLAAAVAKAESEKAALAKEVEAIKTGKPDTVVVSKGTNMAVPEVVMFFDIDKSKLTPEEASRFDSFVYYVKNTIAEGEVVTLVGSCDKQTGSAKYNQKLSKDRAELVKKMLVEQYGIPAEKIVTVADGGSNNRFKVPSMNRCVYVRFK